jgi:hypothetical protein
MNVYRLRLQNDALTIDGGHEYPFLIFGQTISDVQDGTLLVGGQNATSWTITTAVHIFTAAT